MEDYIYIGIGNIPVFIYISILVYIQNRNCCNRTFKTWGPLNRKHHPIKSKQGKTFEKFVQQLQDLGYEVQFRELVAADYGAPTMRKRFFMIARCDGNPILWSEPTHAPRNSKEVKAGLLKPYVGAYTQIDFSRPCPSIFDTSQEIKEKYGIRAVRPLAPKTMERIARGLKKFVLDNPEPFVIKDQQCPILIQYHSETVKGDVRGQIIEDPIMTVDGSNRYGLVTSFLHKYYDGGYKGAGDSVENPLPTVTAWDHNSVVTANLIQMNNHCDGKDIADPLPTITAGDGHFGEVRAFLIKYYGNGSAEDVTEPLDTITSRDRFGLVTIDGVDYQIVDIGLRMLEPRELYGCQGFPDDYIIDHDFEGHTYPRSEQVRRCGNSVCPPLPAVLVRSNIPELCVAERMPNITKDRIKAEENGQFVFA